MSDYERIKAVRYKIPNEIIKIKELQEKSYDEEYIDTEFIAQFLNNKNNNDIIVDDFDVKINNFVINSGLNFETDEYEYFIDYILDYEYGANGNFENVRELTEKEFNKYKEIFKEVLPNLKLGELRLVHYCYYNGVDEPAVWNIEEI